MKKDDLGRTIQLVTSAAVLKKIEEEIESELLHAVRIIEAGTNEQTAKGLKEAFCGLMKDFVTLMSETQSSLLYSQCDKMIADMTKETIERETNET